MELSVALDHIKRNGDLLFAPCSGFEAVDAMSEMKRLGLTEVNPWSGRVCLTAAGEAKLAASH